MGMRGRWFFCVLCLLTLMAPVSADAAAERAYAMPNIGLELDGVFVGWLHSAEGGAAVGQVVNEPPGQDMVIKKHIGGVRYQDITLTFGAGMARPFYQWISDTLDGKFMRKSGALIFSSYDQSSVKRLVFQQAMITEVGFPAVDGASKDAIFFTVKISPEMTRNEPGGKGPGATGKTEMKKMLGANFRLNIAGIDTSRVNKVGPLVVKVKVSQNAIGEARDYQTEPSFIETPNMIIEMAETNAKQMNDWHTDFVIKGINSPDREKIGSLEYLLPNMAAPLFTVTLKNLGIIRIEPPKTVSKVDSISRLEAEMYVERIGFASMMK